MAKSAQVSDCEVTDCVVQGYSLPNRGSLMRSRGNAAYGPLLCIHIDSHSSQQIDLEIMAAPHALGDHPLGAIKGRKHQIRFGVAEGNMAISKRPIIVGYPLRFDFLSVDYPRVPAGMEANFKKFAPDGYRASEIRLSNGTLNPVVIGKLSQGNRISSLGEVRDDGQGNSVRRRAH